MAQTKSSHVLFLHSKPRILWKYKGPQLPEITIELTERCNNNCLHCCINQCETDVSSLAREMSLELCMDLLKQAADMGALTVRLTGGEPLLHKNFVDIYLYARRLGMKVLVFTNARLITPELADLFARVPPIEKIEITSYGMNRGSYEYHTQKRGSFSEYQNGIKLLIKKNVPFFVKGTLLPKSRSEMAEFLDWSSRLPWKDPSPSFIMFLELRHRRDSLAKNIKISGMRISPKEGVKILAMNPDLYRREMANFFKNFWERPTTHVFRCREKACIDAYGKIQYCLALRHPDTVLDARQYSLKYAVKKFWPELIRTRSSNEIFLIRCANCFLRALCQQCPAKSWNEFGGLDQPVEYWCQIAHEEARFLGLIASKENAWEVKNWRDRIARLNNFNVI